MLHKNPVDGVTREFAEDFPQLYQRLEWVQVVGARKIRAVCPAHDDHDPSLHLEVRDTDDSGRQVVFKCFVCQDQEKVRGALGLDWSAFYNKTTRKKTGTYKTVATYDYVDLAGELRYQVRRKQDEQGNKDFPQYRPDGKGGFVPGLEGVARVPYRLPQLVAAVRCGRVVVKVEGEKDVHTGEERMPDLTWTTNSGGAEKFTEELAPFFIGADVVMIPDNDPAGEKHVTRVGELLLPVARRVRVLRLPGLGEKEDLTDWFEVHGHTPEEFMARLEDAPLFEPAEKKEPEGLYGAVRFSELGPPAPRRFLVGTLMPKGHVTMLYGAGGAAKSYIGLFIGISIAAKQKSVFGYPIQESGPVLYMDHELDQDEQGNRAKEICNGLGIPVPHDLMYLAASEYTTREAFGRAYSLCERHGVVSVIVDSLGWALHGDMSSPTDTLAFYREHVSPLRTQLGVTPLIVHHQAKVAVGEKATQKGPFGSVYHENGARSVIQVERRKKDQDGDGVLLRLRPQKANIGAVAPPFGQRVRFGEGKLEFEPWEIPLDDPGEDAEESVPASDQIVGALKQGPKTKIEIQEITGLADSTISNNLSSLVKEEKVVKLSEKVGRHSLYSLPGKEPPGEDKDPSPEPGGPTEPASTDEVREHDHPDKDGPDESYLLTPPLGQGEVSKVVKTERELTQLIQEIHPAEVVAFDFETGSVEKGTALDPIQCTPGVLSVAYPGTGKDGVTVQVSKVDPRPLLAAMRGKLLIAHNAKFDLSVAKHHYGYDHDGPVFDPMVVNRLIHFATGKRKPEGSKRKVPQQRIGEGLEDLVEKFLQVELIKDQQGSDWLVNELSDEQIAYARTDAAILLPLKDEIEKKIHELGLEKVLELEMRVTPALAWMESAGISISEEKWLALAKKAEAARDAALLEAQYLLPEHPEGETWNINSPNQILNVLRILGVDLTKLPETSGGKDGNNQKPSVSEQSLKTIKEPDSARTFVDALLRYKAAAKESSTYGRKWLEPPQFRPKAKKHPWSKKRQEIVEGRLYTEFQQLVRSGRFSSKEPNVQNLPRQGGYREVFETPPGRTLVLADYSQIEVLIASAIAPDTKMYRAFKAGEDVHANTARVFLGDRQVSDAEFKEFRAKAKTITFGNLYAMGSASLVEYARDTFGTPLSRNEAKEYQEKFFETYPGFAAWHERAAKMVDAGHEVTQTPLGRLRKLSLVPTKKKGKNDEQQWRLAFNECVNHPVQGGKADGTKVTLARLYEFRQEAPGSPVPVDLIHDAFAVECDEEYVEEVKEWLLTHMIEGMREGTGFLDLPVKVEWSISKNLGGNPALSEGFATLNSSGSLIIEEK